MKYRVSVGDGFRVVEIDASGVRIDGLDVDVDVVPVGDSSTLSIMVDGRSFSVVARRSARGRWQFQAEGHDVPVEVVDERTAKVQESSAAGRSAGPALTVEAPMPGMVVKVEVAEGDVVVAGQGLIIVEAMKMENELTARTTGRVARVLTAPGQAVEKGQVLIEFSGDETP